MNTDSTAMLNTAGQNPVSVFTFACTAKSGDFASQVWRLVLITNEIVLNIFVKMGLSSLEIVYLRHVVSTGLALGLEWGRTI